MKVIQIAVTIIMVLISMASCKVSGDKGSVRLDLNVGRSSVERIKASGIDTTITREFSAFDTIHVTGGYNLKYIQGEPCSVTISGSDNIVPLVVTDVSESGELTVSFCENYSVSNADIRLVITAPTLKHIRVDGAAKIDIPSLNTEGDFSCMVNGAAEIGISSITCNDLTININGASSADIQDIMSKSLTTSIDGAGAVKLQGVNNGHAEFYISGTGVINAKKLLSITCEKHVSGLGIVRL